MMDLATIDTLRITTRTVRKRLDLTRAVPRDVIEQCLEIAMQAPTGGNIPRSHFVVVTDAAKRAHWRPSTSGRIWRCTRRSDRHRCDNQTPA